MFKDFTSLEEKKYEDLALILADDGVTVDLYRRGTPVSGNTGFNAEVGDLQLIARISAVFGQSKSSVKISRDGIGRTMSHTFTVLTDYKKMKLNDRILYSENWYEVVEIDRGSGVFDTVICQKLG